MIFFFSFVVREQKIKLVLTFYQDALIFSLLKDTKNDYIKTTQTNFDPLRSCLTWQINSSKKESILNEFMLNVQAPFSLLCSFSTHLLSLIHSLWSINIYTTEIKNIAKA